MQTRTWEISDPGEEELQLKTASLQLLRDIAIAANEARTPEDVFLYSLEKICQFGNWSLAHVYWSDEPEILRPSDLWYSDDLERFKGFRQRTKEISFQKGLGLPGRVLETGKPAWITDAPVELAPVRSKAARDSQIISAFALPVMAGMEVGAVLEFFSTEEKAVDEDMTDLMAQIGTQLGRVIERKRAEEQIQRQADRLKALVELSHLLAESETDVKKVLDTITKRVTELVGDTCTISLRSADGKHLNAASFYHPDPEAMKLLEIMNRVPLPADSGSLGKVFQSGKSELIENISQEELRASALPEYLPYLDRYDNHAMLIVPLREHGQPIGTLAVARYKPGKSYSKDDQTFLQEIGDRAAQAIYNAQLFGALQRELTDRKQVEYDLTELQRLLMDSVDLERLSLAKKLHDDAIQGLYGIIFTLEGMRDGVPDEKSQIQLKQISGELQSVINRLQGTFKELQPPTLVPFGLDKAIAAAVENFITEHQGFKVHMDLSPDVKVPERIGYTLFRIFQQTMDNIVKHASASEISILLLREERWVILDIRDNGTGFTLPRRWIDLVRQGHYGLARLRERAEAIGGKLKIESQPGQGTRVRIEVPLPD